MANWCSVVISFAIIAVAWKSDGQRDPREAHLVQKPAPIAAAQIRPGACRGENSIMTATSAQDCENESELVARRNFRRQSPQTTGCAPLKNCWRWQRARRHRDQGKSATSDTLAPLPVWGGGNFCGSSYMLPGAVWWRGKILSNRSCSWRSVVGRVIFRGFRRCPDAPPADEKRSGEAEKPRTPVAA